MRSGRSGGLDPGLTSMAYRGWLLWILGYPDQAVVTLEHVVQLAKELLLHFSLAVALLFYAAVRQLRGEPEKTLTLAEETISVSRTYGFPVWEALGVAWRGWALTRIGRVDEGIAQIREGADPYGATGQRVVSTQLLGLLSEGYLTAGRPELAIATVEEALEKATDTGEQYFEAELLRLKGNVLLKLSEHLQDKAMVCFSGAVDAARKQGAKSYQLRAAIDLAKILSAQNRRGEARESLSGIYGWFAEGFETSDYKAARSLLSELS